MPVWRIGTDTPTYLADDLSGSGAEATDGRWNKKGTPMLYASSSRALACLEALVHLAGGAPLPLNRYLVELAFPEEVWAARVVFDAATHVGWDAAPAGNVSIEWGDDWTNSKASLLAEVPSIIVPESRTSSSTRHTPTYPKLPASSSGNGHMTCACGDQNPNLGSHRTDLSPRYRGGGPYSEARFSA